MTTDYTVSAVDEAVALMLLVAQNPGLGVSQLAQRSGNTKARTFRLLFTLEQRRLVTRMGKVPTYHLDVQALYLGVAAQEQVDLVGQTRPLLLALGGECHENVQLRVRDGLDSVCIDRWQSARDQPIRSQAGSRRRLHAGTSCTLLLAYAPEEVRQALFSSELPRYTPQTLTHRSRLTQEISRIHAEGYSVSMGEITPGFGAFAAPVRGKSGQVLAALSITGPMERLQASQAQLVAQLCSAARRMSRVLAGEVDVEAVTGPAASADN